jgi:hypothetical protein
MTYESIKCFGCRSRGDENEELRAQLAAETARRESAERERDEARGKAAYMVEAFWLAIADIDHAEWCGNFDEGGECDCWRSAAAKVDSTDEAVALCTRVRDLEDEREEARAKLAESEARAGAELAKERDLYVRDMTAERELSLTEKTRAARWKALARRLRGERLRLHAEKCAALNMFRIERERWQGERCRADAAESDRDRMWGSAMAMLGAGIERAQGHWEITRTFAKDAERERAYSAVGDRLLGQTIDRLHAASRARFADAWMGIGWVAWCDGKIVAAESRTRELAEALRRVSSECEAEDHCLCCRISVDDDPPHEAWCVTAIARAALASSGEGDGNG